MPVRERHGNQPIMSDLFSLAAAVRTCRVTDYRARTGTETIMFPQYHILLCYGHHATARALSRTSRWGAGHGEAWMRMKAGTRRMKSWEARALWVFDRRLAGSVGHQNRNKTSPLQTCDPLTQQPDWNGTTPFPSRSFLSLGSARSVSMSSSQTEYEGSHLWPHLSHHPSRLSHTNKLA